MNTYDVCVLVSGGIDSLVAYHLYKKQGKKVAPLFVNLDQPYAKAELEVCRKLYPDLIEAGASFCMVGSNMPTVDSQEVFGRNLLLALYGAQLAPVVVLSALATEMNDTAVPDKRPEFFQQATQLLSLVMCNKWPSVQVVTPFGMMTKSDVVAEGLGLGITPETFLTSRSCYDPEHHACGRCSTCFKRWISLHNNHIEEQYAYPINENTYGLTIVPLIRQCVASLEYTPRFTVQRCRETLGAVDRV